MALITKPKYGDEQVKQPGTNQESSLIAPTGGQPTQQQPGQQANKGSGQFTNIQKIVGANKQAGQQIGQNVSGQVQKNVAGQQKAQEQAFKAAGSGLGQAQSTLTSGQGYLDTLQKGQQDALGLAQDQNKLKELTKFRLGAGVNEQELGQQATEAATQTSLLGQQAKQQQDLANTQAGRFNLLRQTFARPTYTSGQQQLDSTLFGTSGKAGIGKVQQTAAEINKQAAEKAQLQATQSEDIGKIAGQEQDLAKGLTEKTQGFVSDYQKQLEEQVKQENDRIEKEQAEFKRNFDILTKKQDPNKMGTQETVSEDFMKQLGLTEGQNIYNVFDNLTPEQIANISSRRAATIADVADQSEVDQMKALQMLAQSGLDDQGNVVKNYQDMLDKAADPIKAIELRQGEGSLQDQLKKADDKFKQEILNEMITGRAQQDYGEAWAGTSGTANASANATLAQIMAGFDPRRSSSAGHQLGMMDLINPAAAMNAFIFNNLGFDAGAGGAQRSVNQQVIDQILGKADQRLKETGAFRTIGSGGINEGQTLAQRRDTAKAESKQAMDTVQQQLNQRLASSMLNNEERKALDHMRSLKNSGINVGQQPGLAQLEAKEAQLAKQRQQQAVELLKDPKIQALKELYDKGGIARGSDTRSFEDYLKNF